MGTTAQKLQAILDSKSDIKDAIEAKGVTVGDAAFDEYAGKINAIPTPVEEAPENDVCFYDYDGKRIASFTIAQAKALTELPTPPQHEGLTFQEWNWSLADIVAYERQYIDIGAHYAPTDGKTHILVEVDAETITFKLKPITSAATLDWGDGSSQSVPAASTEVSHTYAQAGSYDITIVSTATYQFDTPLNYPRFMAVTKELRLAKDYNAGINYSFSGFCCKMSIPSDIDNFNLIRGFCYSRVPMIAVPNIGVNFNNYFPFQNLQGRVCFPSSMVSYSGSNLLQNNCLMTHVVLPKQTNATSVVNRTSFQSLSVAKVISLPETIIFNASYDDFFNGCWNLEYLDIKQGYVPNCSIRLSYSYAWTTESLVKFFGKLGTASSAITLTFGAVNLGKLTADQKAIATNKGYTLA